MIIECNLCGWQTEDDNIYGKQRHEEWHDGSQAKKHASQNKIWGKVKWANKT